MKDKIVNFIKQEYGVKPEYLWKKYPTFCVFRHIGNNKWFALVATLPRKFLSAPGDGEVDFINVKCDKENTDFLRGVPGILPAYHMNKQNWITVLLDGTMPIKNVKKLLQDSFDLTM